MAVPDHLIAFDVVLVDIVLSVAGTEEVADLASAAAGQILLRPILADGRGHGIDAAGWDDVSRKCLANIVRAHQRGTDRIVNRDGGARGGLDLREITGSLSGGG